MDTDGLKPHDSEVTPTTDSRALGNRGLEQCNQRGIAGELSHDPRVIARSIMPSAVLGDWLLSGLFSASQPEASFRAGVFLGRWPSRDARGSTDALVKTCSNVAVEAGEEPAVAVECGDN